LKAVSVFKIWIIWCLNEGKRVPAGSEMKMITNSQTIQAYISNPTAAARVQALGQVFSENFRFPLLFYIPSASPKSSSLSLDAGTIGQEWPQCQ
jgi:hypothetical protein